MRSARIGLYLVTPIGLSSGGMTLEAFLPSCAKALESGRVDALLLRTSGSEGRPDEARLLKHMGALLDLAHGFEVPVLIEGRADLVGRGACDGVHLDADSKQVAAVRRALGEDATIGAGAGTSRHAAMEAAAAGADYVSFGSFDPEPQPPPLELLSWWQELMEPPCVAMGGVSLENAEQLCNAGADFLALRQAVWNHPDGPAKAIKAFASIVDNL